MKVKNLIHKISINGNSIGYLDCVNCWTRTGVEYLIKCDDLNEEVVYVDVVNSSLSGMFTTSKYGIISTFMI